ncbi:MAG: rhodanese-like domain-containing protein [Parvularcula sp.]|jgi:rhodanese-related sulfurtransferase|nr:rhodanese-like domain-containing protein [Parvularcula sp.]
MIEALLAFAFLLQSETLGTQKDGVVHLDAREAAQLLEQQPEVQVLDVRTEGEFEEGHIAGAAQINYLAPNFKAQARRLDMSKPYLVHCRSGHRSSRAVRVLKELGADTIYHLDGGILAWREAGLPLTQPKEAKP